MTDDDRLDKLAGMIGESKASKPRRDSRLGSQEITAADARKATGAKRSEKTAVVSFRVPDYVERAAAQAAADLRVPYSELKKAIFYRGLLAFTRDGEEVPIQYDRNAEATPPSL